jgi:hypothetical protein
MYRIAISGRANSGKNTLAKLISTELDCLIHLDRWDCKILAFADPLKDMAMLMLPKTKKEYWFGPSHLREEVIPNYFKDGKPLTYRQVLFDIGTQLGRGYNDNCWLHNFDARYEQLFEHIMRTTDWKPPDLVVVSDVRFRNEFDHLKQKGFYQIRLYRETGQPIINHISETNQVSIQDSEFDYVLHNNQSLADLEKEVRTKIIPQLVSQ